MEKKKIYIIFTYELYTLGGTQMYTAGKTKYLESLGWEVYVFCAGSNSIPSPIPSLNKYIKSGGGLNFILIELYKLKKFEQQQYIDIMLERLNNPAPEECEIIIESHADIQAYWAELLAAKLEARHFFVACNEVYRPTPTYPIKTYEDNLDFFYFKWGRNELVGRGKTYKKLFNGYKNITAPLYNMPHTVQEMHAVQDVDFPIEKIKKIDWNICHIGRAVKSCVPYVIEGVGEFALRHP